jgi:hypothetical protein
MDEILRGAGGTQTLRTYDADGNPADVDGTNPPTVQVTDSAGATVPGFSASRSSVGVYTLEVPASLQVLDVYQVAWSWPNGQSRRTAFELVGGFLFSVADARSLAADPLADATRYPAEDIVRAREAVSERFERWCGLAFRPRGRRAVLDGTGRSLLVLPDERCLRIVSVQVDGQALTSEQLGQLRLDPAGLLRWVSGTWPVGVDNVVVLYEHGYDPTPEPVVRAAVRYARHLLAGSPYDDRATAVFTDVGGFRLNLAGRDGPTGLPEVDAVLAEYAGIRMAMA